LAAVFASFTIRIRKTDLFEGRPIADFTEGVKFTYGHGLTENERRLQAKTRTLWDHGLRAHNKANRIGGFMEWKTALKDVGDARLGIVHHLCLKYRYSEEGDANEALGEKTANIPTEDIIDTMRKTKGTLSSEGQVNRVLLRAATKRSWRESSRIVVSMNIMRRHFEQHGWESQLVIFSDYLSALDVLENAILELFKDRVRIARYDGTVDAETRAAHAKAFQDGRINLFLATTKAGGYGLTLTKANGVLHLTEPWNPGAAEQCTARAIRIGTDHTVYVYVPYAHDSIERRIKLIAKMKLRKASKVVDPDASMRARMAEVSAYTREQLRSKVGH
jgi:SNF2 family DNA or RNA helicase